MVMVRVSCLVSLTVFLLVKSRDCLASLCLNLAGTLSVTCFSNPTIVSLRRVRCVMKSWLCKLHSFYSYYYYYYYTLVCCCWREDWGLFGIDDGAAQQTRHLAREIRD
jgi:hypothetical protein